MLDHRFHKFALKHLEYTAKIFSTCRWRLYPDSVESKNAAILLKQINPNTPKYGFSDLTAAMLMDWYSFGCCYWQESFQDNRRVLTWLYPGTVVFSNDSETVYYYNPVTKEQLYFHVSSVVKIPWSTLPLPSPAFLMQDIMIAIANRWGWGSNRSQWDLSTQIANEFVYSDQLPFSVGTFFNDLNPNPNGIISLDDANHTLKYEAWLDDVVISSLKEIFAYINPIHLRSATAQKLYRKYSTQSQVDYLVVMGMALTTGLSRLTNLNFEFV